jgi:Ca-activated chloride channel homolog
MKYSALFRVTATLALLAALTAAPVIPGSPVAAQSGRQPPKKKVEKKTEEQDKKKAPGQAKPGEEEPQDPVPPVPRSQKDEPPIKLSTQVVNVDVTVIDKKTGRLYSNLTQKDFIIYEDKVKQEVTNFRSGEGPMTVVLLLDNGFQNRYWKGYFNPTFTQEIFQSAAVFVQGFVKPQDFVSVVTFSMKPKVIQDFTSDTQRLYAAILAAYRDTLNFSESNLYDGLAFTLLGGKAIQLYDERAGPSEYTGLQEIEGHTAIILITTGVDTFSRITLDKTLKIVAQAGVPIFSVGVGNLFFKKYEHMMSADQRLTFLQAMNQLNAFAERTGGAYYPMTFESEIPQIMRSIEAILRNQYSVGYSPTNTRREGKERKIKLEVDVDGDGLSDNKRLDLRFRQSYIEPNDNPKK